MKIAASAIAELTLPVFEHLERIAASASSMQLAEATATGVLPAADAERLGQLAIAAVQESEMITGAGMAAVSGRDPGSGMMNWWILRDGNVVAKRHILNPASDSFYDFSRTRWFQNPARTGRATLIAPYVDSWGTDDLTVTAAIPLTLADSAITAIIAADLDARSYIQHVEQILRQASPAALLDLEDRAVASTVSEVETGVRLKTLQTWSVIDRVPLADLDWSLVVLSARDRG
jgi:hypothetical protein